jgi:hypothetical protein
MKMTKAVAVYTERFAEVGPGKWWFVYHPDGFLIECATESKAIQLASEINAGRDALRKDAGDE